MDKRKLNKVFEKVRIQSGMDYAITNADDYGDCMTCVNDELCDVYGIESTGIWAKHWVTGMNKGMAWEDINSVHIAHDITELQANVMVKVLKDNGYKVEPEQYDRTKCFLITEE